MGATVSLVGASQVANPADAAIAAEDTPQQEVGQASDVAPAVEVPVLSAAEQAARATGLVDDVGTAGQPERDAAGFQTVNRRTGFGGAPRPAPAFSPVQPARPAVKYTSTAAQLGRSVKALRLLNEHGRDFHYWSAHRHSQVAEGHLRDELTAPANLNKSARDATKKIRGVLDWALKGGMKTGVVTNQQVFEKVRNDNAGIAMLYSVLRRLVDLIMAAQAEAVIRAVAVSGFFEHLQQNHTVMVTADDIRELRSNGELLDVGNRFANLIVQSANFWPDRTAFSFWELCRAVACVRGPKKLLSEQELEALIPAERKEYGERLRSVQSYLHTAAAMMDALRVRRHLSRHLEAKQAPVPLTRWARHLPEADMSQLSKFECKGAGWSTDSDNELEGYGDGDTDSMGSMPDMTSVTNKAAEQEDLIRKVSAMVVSMGGPVHAAEAGDTAAETSDAGHAAQHAAVETMGDPMARTSQMAATNVTPVPDRNVRRRQSGNVSEAPATLPTASKKAKDRNKQSARELSFADPLRSLPPRPPSYSGQPGFSYYVPGEHVGQPAVATGGPDGAANFPALSLHRPASMVRDDEVDERGFARLPDTLVDVDPASMRPPLPVFTYERSRGRSYWVCGRYPWSLLQILFDQSVMPDALISEFRHSILNPYVPSNVLKPEQLAGFFEQAQYRILHAMSVHGIPSSLYADMLLVGMSLFLEYLPLALIEYGNGDKLPLEPVQLYYFPFLRGAVSAHLVQREAEAVKLAGLATGLDATVALGLQSPAVSNATQLKRATGHGGAAALGLQPPITSRAEQPDHTGDSGGPVADAVTSAPGVRTAVTPSGAVLRLPGVLGGDAGGAAPRTGLGAAAATSLRPVAPLSMPAAEPGDPMEGVEWGLNLGELQSDGSRLYYFDQLVLPTVTTVPARRIKFRILQPGGVSSAGVGSTVKPCTLPMPTQRFPASEDRFAAEGSAWLDNVVTWAINFRHVSAEDERLVGTDRRQHAWLSPFVPLLPKKLQKALQFCAEPLAGVRAAAVHSPWLSGQPWMGDAVDYLTPSEARLVLCTQWYKQSMAAAEAQFGALRYDSRRSWDENLLQFHALARTLQLSSVRQYNHLFQWMENTDWRHIVWGIPNVEGGFVQRLQPDMDEPGAASQVAALLAKGQAVTTHWATLDEQGRRVMLGGQVGSGLGVYKRKPAGPPDGQPEHLRVRRGPSDVLQLRGEGVAQSVADLVRMNPDFGPTPDLPPNLPAFARRIFTSEGKCFKCHQGYHPKMRCSAPLVHREHAHANHLVAGRGVAPVVHPPVNAQSFQQLQQQLQQLQQNMAAYQQPPQQTQHFAQQPYGQPAHAPWQSGDQGGGRFGASAGRGGRYGPAGGAGRYGSARGTGHSSGRGSNAQGTRGGATQGGRGRGRGSPRPSPGPPPGK